MDKILRSVTPPVNPDLADTEGCMNELIQPNSHSSSSTAENSMDTFRRNANAGQGAWTNEKHNLYLNRLEASFVDQLSRSMGLLTWHSEKKPHDQQNSSKKLPVNTGIASDQFTVLRDGCWQKINFEKNQHLLKTASNSHSFLESPWARHFRREGKFCTTSFDDLQEKIALPKVEIHSRGKRTFSQGLAASLNLMINHQILQDSGGSLAEVSDQNFVDGDRNEKSSDLSKAKRLKKVVEDSSSHDQGNFALENFRLSVLLHRKEKNNYAENGYWKTQRASSYKNTR